MTESKDRIFDEKMGKIPNFAFNEAVASVFDDMISRSVPFYDEIHKIILDLVDRRFQNNGRIYDIGCSTGTTINLIAQMLKNKGIHPNFIGIDSSAPMLERAEKKLSLAGVSKCELFCEDAVNFQMAEAEMVIMNYTLQFIPLEQRLTLLKNIYDSMQPGGIFLISEKLYSKDETIDNLLTELYYDFKRRNGYSELEISQKREALENVLVPLTPKEQVNLLRDSGFEKTEMIFRWYNFASYLCIK